MLACMLVGVFKLFILAAKIHMSTHNPVRVLQERELRPGEAERIIINFYGWM